VCWYVEYFSSSYRKRDVFDFSKEGLRVAGTCHVGAAMSVTLRMFLPNQQDPVNIRSAFVRWTNGRDCGVQFGTLDPEVDARLNQFLGISAANLHVTG